METLLTIIIVAVALFLKVRQGMKAYQKNRPGQKRDGELPDLFPPPLPTKREPGPVLRRPQSPPPLRPTTLPQYGERGLPQLLDELLGLDILESEPVEVLPVQPPEPAPEEGGSGPTLPPLAASVSSEQLFSQSLAPAFPAAAKKNSEHSDGSRRPFRIHVRGKADLRRAVVLSEVLGRPRAYDV
ncbi:MAG TPA: hypothetical protein PKY10_12895 [Lentisphaeria bacterium]|nr:hypothetical protein [Lentisphaeria bacterium]